MIVCVVGLGYVGLPQALLLAEHHAVIGCDISRSRVEALNRVEAPFHEPGLGEALAVASKNGFRANVLPVHADAFVICVPTPLDEDCRMDATPLVDACKSLVPVLRGGELVVIESTVSVGACRDIVAPILGGGVDIVYCPERAMPGNTFQEIRVNPRVVGADTPEAWCLVQELYGPLGLKLVRTSVDVAETVKLAENTFRAVNIALANELSVICEDNDVDVREVISIANMHPRVEYLSPGAGVGGHCLPLDPWFLIYGHEAPIIQDSLSANRNRPKVLADRVRGKTVLVCGLSYKPDVDDFRESPSELLIAELESRGKTVLTHDPSRAGRSLESLLPQVDSVVLMVRHSEYLKELPSMLQWHDVTVYDFCGLLPPDWKPTMSRLVRMGGG